MGRMYDLTTGQTAQVAQHDAPVKSIGWVDAPQGGILVTGSWDKTLKVRNTLTRFPFPNSLTGYLRSIGT